MDASKEFMLLSSISKSQKFLTDEKMVEQQASCGAVLHMRTSADTFSSSQPTLPIWEQRKLSSWHLGLGDCGPPVVTLLMGRSQLCLHFHLKKCLRQKTKHWLSTCNLAGPSLADSLFIFIHIPARSPLSTTLENMSRAHSLCSTSPSTQ